MEYLIGVGLAMAVCVFAMLTGFDRDRVFYPTVVAVNATYYILFAVMGSSPSVLVVESLTAAAFFAVAVAGFKKNLWLAVAGLAFPCHAAHATVPVSSEGLDRYRGTDLCTVPIDGSRCSSEDHAIQTHPVCGAFPHEVDYILGRLIYRPTSEAETLKTR
jgi:hypothetical protein